MTNILLGQSDKFNPNYGIRIIRVKNVIPHPNADKLDIIKYYDNNIIVGRDSVKEGDIVVFCPAESALDLEFLKLNNQFRDKTLNANQEETGFFEHHGRVKALSLRGEISTGFIFPYSWLQVWIPDIIFNNIENYIEIPFDTVNGKLFSKKYVIKISQHVNGGNGVKVGKNAKLFDKLIDGQFNFHYDTGKLADNIDRIDPEDVILITTKFHGSSMILAHVLVKKKLKWYEKILKRCGVNIVDKEYDYIYSSRGVIKNRFNTDGSTSYYKTDIWKIAYERLKPFISKGQTIYCELCGYEPNTDRFIQKNHDYKNKHGQMSIHIYRITSTNEDGVVYEWSMKQVVNWCSAMGLNFVNELYYGKAKDVFPELSTTQHWHENFLDELSKDKERFYMEVNSPDCNNKVPHEGIVIRVENKDLPAFKLKTKAHFLMETKDLDEGIVDTETLETVDNGQY